MSNKYDLAGAHVLNKFVWSRLESAGLLDKSNYSGLIPIIPTQQIPVFNEMGTQKPFIVYNYIVVGYSVALWSHTEQMTYTVYSDDETQLRRIQNFLVDLLRRFDITAQEVNDFVGAPNDPGDLVNPSHDTDDRQFDFKFVTVIAGQGPEPFTTEKGRQSVGVTVRYNYTRDENAVSMRA